MALLIVAWRFLLLLLSGEITLPFAFAAASLLPVVILGGWFGTRIFAGLSKERFYQIFQAVLLLAAAVLLVRGLLTVSGNYPA
jgi:uncharacterized membrane protein YfcA